MRSWIGLVLAMALMTAPVVGHGQEAARASAQRAWLRLELNEPEGLQVPQATRPSLAYIPEHFRQRLPKSRHPTATTFEEAAPPPAPSTDAADQRNPEPEAYVADPALPPLDIQRWHPEAYDPSVKSERELELKYATPAGATEESEHRLSKQARIAIGVIVPLAVAGIAAGTAIAVSFRNWEW